jgi:hypothetical protein
MWSSGFSEENGKFGKLEMNVAFKPWLAIERQTEGVVCFGRQFNPKHTYSLAVTHRVKKPPDA